MINLLVTIVIFLLIIGLVWYIAGLLPIPEPFKKIALAIIGVIFVIWLLTILLGHASWPVVIR